MTHRGPFIVELDAGEQLTDRPAGLAVAPAIRFDRESELTDVRSRPVEYPPELPGLRRIPQAGVPLGDLAQQRPRRAALHRQVRLRWIVREVVFVDEVLPGDEPLVVEIIDDRADVHE